MSHVTTFQVIVARTSSGGYRVSITDQNNGEFATVRAPELWTAFRMAVPYMAAAAEPDPFADLLRKGGMSE